MSIIYSNKHLFTLFSFYVYFKGLLQVTPDFPEVQIIDNLICNKCLRHLNPLHTHVLFKTCNF